jgi:hypothetical protein
MCSEPLAKLGIAHQVEKYWSFPAERTYNSRFPYFAFFWAKSSM